MKFFKRIIYFVVSLFVFTNFFAYCSVRPDILPLNSTYLIFGIILLCFFLVVVYFEENYYLYNKLNIWIIFYLFIYLFWSLFNHLYLDSNEYRRNFLTIISLFAFIVFLSFENKKLYFTRLGIFVATLIGSFNNIYEFFYPETFFPLNSGIKTLGRSAGFYVNSNIAGTALNLGLLLSIGLIGKKYRSLFAFFIFIGVLATFSRSGMAGWFLIMMILSYKNVLDIKKIILLSTGLLSAIYFGLPKISNFLNENMPGAVKNLTNRLLWFSNPTLHRDFSQNEREMAAGKAWDIFMQKPFFGNGIGFTSHWDFPAGPHNIYLVTLAEYGLIGSIIYPLLVILSLGRVSNLKTPLNLTFLIITLFVGFFSHNLLTDTFLLYSCAIVSTINFNIINYGKKPFLN